MPTLKILLPVDIQHPHEELVEQLDKLVHIKDSQLHLLYVKDELPGYEQMLGTMGDFPEDWQHQIEAKVAEVFGRLKVKLEAKGAHVTTETVGGPAAMMIETVARDENFNMIAMMPGSHSRVEQYLLGSTTSRVIGHAPGTVLVVRNIPAGVALQRAVIAIDGSEAALNAAKTAVSLFGLAEREVQVTLINVVSVTGIFKFISPVRFVAAIEDNLVMSGEASLAAAESVLSELGVTNLDNVLKNGDPADEIITFAESIGAELIIMGAQGRSAVEKFLVGSVSSRVSTLAKCSTAIIK